MVPDAEYEEGVGQISPQGVPQADGTETTEGAGRRLSLKPPEGGDG